MSTEGSPDGGGNSRSIIVRGLEKVTHHFSSKKAEKVADLLIASLNTQPERTENPSLDLINTQIDSVLPANLPEVLVPISQQMQAIDLADQDLENNLTTLHTLDDYNHWDQNLNDLVGTFGPDDNLSEEQKEDILSQYSEILASKLEKERGWDTGARTANSKEARRMILAEIKKRQDEATATADDTGVEPSEDNATNEVVQQNEAGDEDEGRRQLQETIGQNRTRFDQTLAAYRQFHEIPGNGDIDFNQWQQTLSEDQRVNLPDLARDARVEIAQIKDLENILSIEDSSQTVRDLISRLETSMFEGDPLPSGFSDVDSSLNPGWRERFVGDLKEHKARGEIVAFTNIVDEFLSQHPEARQKLANGESYLPDLFRTFNLEDVLRTGTFELEDKFGVPDFMEEIVQKAENHFIGNYLPWSLVDLRNTGGTLVTDLLARLTPDQAASVTREWIRLKSHNGATELPVEDDMLKDAADERERIINTIEPGEEEREKQFLELKDSIDSIRRLFDDSYEKERANLVASLSQQIINLDLSEQEEDELDAKLRRLGADEYVQVNTELSEHYRSLGGNS